MSREIFIFLRYFQNVYETNFNRLRYYVVSAPSGNCWASNSICHDAVITERRKESSFINFVFET